MAEKMQGLEFEVKSSGVEKASSGLNKLANALGKLKNAADGGGALSKVAAELREFGDATKKLDFSNIKDLGNAVKNIGNKSGKLDAVASSLRSISQIDFSNISGAQDAIANLAAAARAIGQSGARSGGAESATAEPQTSGTTDVSEQAEAAENAASRIDGADSRIRISLSKLAQRIMSANSAWKDLGTYTSKASRNLSEFGRTVSSDLGDVFRNLKSIVGDAMTGVGEKISEKMSGVGDKFEVIANKAKSVFSVILDSAKYAGATIAQPFVLAVQRISAAFQRISPIVSRVFGPLGSAIRTVTSGALRLAGAIGTSLFSAFKKGLGAIGSFAKKIGGGLLTGIKTAGAGIATFSKNLLAMPFKRAASNISGFLKKLNGVGAAFGRILFYRAVRTIIKEIGQAFKDGTNNLYQWSSALNGKFSQSMDRAATSLQYLKNSLGAMVAPIINALVPALDVLADKLVSVINVVNQFLSSITGASTWTRAVKVPAKYADSVEKVGKAAKEAAKYLAPFDELNVLPSESDSGSSGGADGTDFSNMFEEMSVSDKIKDFADQIKQMISNGDWKGIGKLLGDKINELIDSINWAAIGKKIGYAVNALIETLYSLLKTIDFYKFGGHLAELFNNFLSEINPDTLGRLLVRKFTAILDILVGFVAALDWVELGNALAEGINGAFAEFDEWITSYDWGFLARRIVSGINAFIAKTDWSAIGKTMWNAFSSAISFIHNAIKKFNWKSAGKALGKAINGIADNINWTDLGETLSDALKGAFEFLTTAIREVDWKELGEDVKAMLVAIDWNGVISGLFEALGTALAGITLFLQGIIGEAWDAVVQWWHDVAFEDGKFTITGFLDGIGEVCENIVKWIDENIVQPFVNGFKSLFGIHSQSTVMMELGGYVIQGLFNGIKAAWGSITSFFSAKLNAIKDTMKKAWTSIKDTASAKWSEIKSNLSTTWESIKSTASTKWNTMKTTLSSTWESLKSTASTKFSEIKTNISTTWDNVASNATTKWNNIKTNIVNIVGSLKSSMQEKWNALKNWWSSLTLPSFKIKLPHFKLTGSFSLDPPSTPKLSIDWYAKGGIVNGPTLFGAGEAGKEAIVPLERNTGWIDNVAKRLNHSMYGTDGDGMDLGAELEDANGVVVTALYAISSQIIRAIEENGGNSMDINSLARQISTVQQRRARASGTA